MRWTHVPSPTPPAGATREVRKFAWFPTYMSDERTMVWLEHYVEVQRYQRLYHEFDPCQCHDWVCIERR